jgi:tRNA modification GTPase
VALSARTGEGIDQVFGWLESVVRENPSEQAEMHSLSLNQRQWSCLEAVADALAQARETLGDPLLPIDLTTVPLSEALRKVDELMGRDATEAVLTSVFSQFCVGK